MSKNTVYIIVSKKTGRPVSSDFSGCGLGRISTVYHTRRGAKEMLAEGRRIQRVRLTTF